MSKSIAKNAVFNMGYNAVSGDFSFGYIRICGKNFRSIRRRGSFISAKFSYLFYNDSNSRYSFIWC